MRAFLGLYAAARLDLFHLDEFPMRYLVLIVFIIIIASLASALVFLVRDNGDSKRMVRALALRVGLSITLFLFLLISHRMGWISGRLLS